MLDLASASQPASEADDQLTPSQTSSGVCIATVIYNLSNPWQPFVAYSYTVKPDQKVKGLQSWLKFHSLFVCVFFVIAVNIRKKSIWNLERYQKCHVLTIISNWACNRRLVWIACCKDLLRIKFILLTNKWKMSSIFPKAFFQICIKYLFLFITLSWQMPNNKQNKTEKPSILIEKQKIYTKIQSKSKHDTKINLWAYNKYLLMNVWKENKQNFRKKGCFMMDHLLNIFNRKRPSTTKFFMTLGSAASLFFWPRHTERCVKRRRLIRLSPEKNGVLAHS